MVGFDALIVGGGHNGLVCAAYLARGGLRPLVLERRPLFGGACVTEEIAGAPGYRVSTGAAQCGNFRPEIVRDLDLTRFGFELLLPDPLSVFLFPDGRYLSLWQDTARTLEEIRRFSERDARAFPRFYADCLAFLNLIEPLLYADPVPSLDEVQGYFRRAGQTDLFDLFMMGSICDLLKDRFESQAVQAVVGFTSTFGTNAGPRSPGTAYVMAHHLFGGTAGVKGRTGYVRGGMSGLAEALAAAAVRQGAVLRTDAEVARIMIADNAVNGVELLSGERITAPVVVSNADPQRTFLGLVARDHLTPSFTDAVAGIEMQGVALKVNCALDALPRFRAVPTELSSPARVSLCPSLDYMEAAWEVAKHGQPSPHPFMTVHMQSAIDASLAPPGRHTLTCYAQYFPYHLAPSLGSWDLQRKTAGDLVLGTVATYAPDVYDRMVACEVLTPLDMERRFAMTGGHQFHGDLLPRQLFDRRPVTGCVGARTPLDGLYLCGAGAHPGGCVWGAPGQRAARAVMADQRK
jgi:phytoene dehydrogenase-like protein